MITTPSLLPPSIIQHLSNSLSPCVSFLINLLSYILKSIKRILCETIKEFIGKMAGLHADDTNATSSTTTSSGDESIAYKCRVLNEKLDQLLGTLHEEASPVHAATPRASIDEDDVQDVVVETCVSLLN